MAIGNQVGNRRTDDAVPRFVGSAVLAEHLQCVLVDLIELHLQCNQAHWNVVGSNFRDLHLQLNEIVNSAREASDTIAERMRALHATPDGRSDTVAATTTLPVFPAGEQHAGDVVRAVTARLHAAVPTIRAVHDDIDAEYPTSTDLPQPRSSHRTCCRDVGLPVSGKPTVLRAPLRRTASPGFAATLVNLVAAIHPPVARSVAGISPPALGWACVPACPR
ncbi:Dps family protein [Pseudonocardia xinjiangensis]|uniref:Dps family protein n=1 Tax=Pseudonocardia xinjiangensis TaxID=75289 RepID=UPI003D8E13D9